MVYFTHLWQHIFRLSSLLFQIDRWLFALPKGWKFSFGFWVKYTVDNPVQPPSVLLGGNFTYSPLKHMQIRLLEVHPGKPDDIVTASMVTVDLLQAPPFEALSYVWGDTSKRATLIINEQAVGIHSGLFDALHTLRLSDSSRLIWADAICISQMDHHETSHQIKIMGQIYETAKNVVVYLGKPSERTEECMRCLKFFIEPENQSQEPPWLYCKVSETEQNLADILTRPWFERIWTLQEATLARNTTFICGPHQVSWPCDLQIMRSIVFRIKAEAISPYFSTASGYISKLDWSPLINILETQMRQAARREGVTLHRNLLDLAFDFRHRKCAFARDKYIAIFGIIENDQGGKLALASDSSMTLEEVHDRFTAEIRRISDIEYVWRNSESKNFL